MYVFISRSMGPWDSLYKCSTIQAILTAINYIICWEMRLDKIPDGISESWLVCFSKQER